VRERPSRKGGGKIGGPMKEKSKTNKESIDMEFN
jgi:hypothetical protein